MCTSPTDKWYTIYILVTLCLGSLPDLCLIHYYVSIYNHPTLSKHSNSTYKTLKLLRCCCLLPAVKQSWNNGWPITVVLDFYLSNTSFLSTHNYLSNISWLDTCVRDKWLSVSYEDIYLRYKIPSERPFSDGITQFATSNCVISLERGIIIIFRYYSVEKS